MSAPLNNPLAALSPDQLTAVFQAMTMLYNLIAGPSFASGSISTYRSHRAAALTATASTLPKLQEGTYAQWAFTVGDAIRNAGLWDYISGDVTCPTDKTSKEYDLHIQESGAVRAVIIGALDHEKSFRYLGGTTTPKEAWDALRVRYHSSDDSAIRAIEEQLMGLRLEEGGNLIEHIALFKKLKRELDGSEFEVNPTRATQWIWRSLPSSYDHVVLQQQRSKVRNFDAICLELEAHYSSPTVSCSSSPTVTSYTASSSLPEFAREWNIPEDLRKLHLVGAINPALAARANDTCWDCLEIGHEANTPRCNFYRYRIELWGPDAPHRKQTLREPVEQQVNVHVNADADVDVDRVDDRPEPATESPITEPAGPPSRPESPCPASPMTVLALPTSSPSVTSDPLPSPHPSTQSHQPTNSSPSLSFCSIPEIDPNPNISTTPTLSSPSPIYGTLPTRPETPTELREAVQDLVSAVNGSDPLDQPSDWQGPPGRFPHTPASEILETPETPETSDSPIPCVFEEFEASQPLVFKDPQGTPGGTRMVNGGLLSALSLGRHSFTPWEDNNLEDLMESLNASEEASPGGLGSMFELLFPGGFFDLDAALPFSREIVDLFFAWYHAVRIHEGFEMLPKRVCKCGAVTR
ncbi:Copia-like polyprotein/retrotransposon, partial [Rhizoctonia solani AG-3 Rhs1AP]